ncbi:hypothetical protein ACH79_26430 [Bradyrhizobium sp. CCBAU 051011]|uniref:hypothetical protein n=1 Tax=Bradyrhizobium sp. CCBAU 051011 TaxID=858422 RepID=UPI0013739931|nr:hypothetical protein [Bradyrhizobium sp. CCBAU 051011]QHO75640.1 hypothetical protein ACH79_26430 [Bradyrhizobium sp. CCBAU 051011]
MANQKTVVANDATKPSCGPKATRVSDEKRFISDERRVQDALEDDEVREVLRAFHEREASDAGVVGQGGRVDERQPAPSALEGASSVGGNIPCSKKGSCSMTEEVRSYSLPDELEPDLSRVHAYWNGLKRGANDVPFWDDVKFSLRSRLARQSMLIDVLETPLRFRFDLIGADLTEWYGGTIGNKFLGEIDLHAPFDELTLQCQATIEGGAPTYYYQTTSRKGDTEHPAGYTRLLLPLWGNGRIEMLLGSIVFDKAARKNSG